MASETCVPCKDEGRGLVVAHFKGVPAHQSHTGKAIPPMCWHHRHNQPRPNLASPAASPLDKIVDDAHEELDDYREGHGLTRLREREEEGMAEEKCGCGRDAHHKGRCHFRRGADKPSVKTQAIPRTPRLKLNGDGTQGFRYSNLVAQIDGELTELQARIAKLQAAKEALAGL